VKFSILYCATWLNMYWAFYHVKYFISTFRLD